MAIALFDVADADQQWGLLRTRLHNSPNNIDNNHANTLGDSISSTDGAPNWGDTNPCTITAYAGDKWNDPACGAAGKMILIPQPAVPQVGSIGRIK